MFLSIHNSVDNKELFCGGFSLLVTALISSITIYFLFTDVHSIYNSLALPVSILLGLIYLSFNGIMKKIFL